MTCSSVLFQVEFVVSGRKAVVVVKECFSTGLGFLAVLLSCHPPGQFYSESLSSFCLNILLCCSVASRPVAELLFCLEE